MSKLIDEIKLIPSSTYKNKISLEDIEVAIAWMTGEITLKQVATYQGKPRSTTSAYLYLVRAIRQGYQEGIIGVDKKAFKNIK